MRCSSLPLLFLLLVSSPLPAQEDLQELGAKQFFEGKIKQSLTTWDVYLKEHPAALPYHWQRGIALYYAERWAEGRAQFEAHVKVNPQDVENSVWHFLCVARQSSVEEARKALLPVTKDVRVPMRQVLDLFGGTGTAAAVLAAAEALPEPAAQRDALCYAHLYLGLYEEALTHPEAAKAHLLKSSVDYAMPHYMGKVAKLHCQLRGWLPAEK